MQFCYVFMHGSGAEAREVYFYAATLQSAKDQYEEEYGSSPTKLVRRDHT